MARRRPLTPPDLWRLPRVGTPAPDPDGGRVVVPVTTWSLDTDESTTRLWLLPADARRAGAGGRNDPARALTAADVSAQAPAWSPGGDRIAFVRKPAAGKGRGGPKWADQPQLHVLSLEGGEAERVTDMPLGVADPKWFPDGRRIAFLSQVFLDAPTPAATAKRLAAKEKERVEVHATEDRFYRHWDRWLTDGRRHHIFVLDLETREITDLMPRFSGWFDPMEPAGQYGIAPDGRAIAFSASRSAPPHDPLLWGVFLLRVGGRPAAPRDITPKAYPDAGPPLWSPDGNHLVFGARKDPYSWAEPTRLVACDRRGRQPRVLAARWDLHPGEFRFLDARSLAVTADVEGRSGLFRLPLRGGRPREILRGGALTGLRTAGGAVFATRSGLRQPPEIVRIGADGEVRALTAFTAPALRGIELGRTQEIVFEGGAGDRVQMHLVHPPGPRRAKRPLVHLIHGGPHGAFGDEWHWRWNAQVFAGAGYLAALVNFHGSTGFGHAFTRSILGRWGDLPFTDVMRATDVLVERGLADPRRMAATGGSYGGYLASWIAAKTDRFACIVNHAGVSDLQTQCGMDVPQGWPVSAGGSPWDDREGLDRFNPLRHADGFRSPMLVLHGVKDYRVPYAQALQVYNVYRARGLPARLVVYPGENHWILKPGNSIHWYGEFLGWLRRWLGPRGRRK